MSLHDDLSTAARKQKEKICKNRLNIRMQVQFGLLKEQNRSLRCD
jgi:hypothetical protein